MTSEKENLDENIDYYKSINSLDQQSAGLKEDPDADVDVQFDIEFETVFKTLATDMYDSPKAGIREALTNATTAVLRAIREHDLDSSDATIEMTLYEDRGMLVIQDNGNGMTRREIEDIVSVIGVSSTLDKEDLAGQFGMGFISLFMLAGLDGGFIMHTHSRRDGAEPISGAWRGRGFEYDDEEKLVNRFDEDQYGTRFEIPLDPAIDTADIRTWVDELCKYCRTPVVYREVDGSETYNTEYGAHRLRDEYPDDDPVLTVETPYFVAHNTPEASGKTLLLDVPTDRNHYLSPRAAPFREIDLRMKQENGVVVEGEHEGKIPLRRSEYAGLPDNIKEKYVVQDELGSDEIVMPGPISNRDKLAENSDFWEWLANKFRDTYRERVESTLNSVSEPQDLFQKSRTDFELAYRFPDRIPRRRRRTDTPQQVFQRELDANVDDKVMNFLITCLKEVDHITPTDEIEDIEQLGYAKYAGQVAYKAVQDNGDVYMGVSLNSNKAQVVWNDDDANQVVRVEETEEYSELEDKFDWKKLKEITKDTIDEYDVSDEVASPFKSQQRSSVGEAPDRDILLHFGRRERSKHTWNVGELLDGLDVVEKSGNIPNGLENVNAIVLFPSNTDRNVSNHRWLASSRVGIATCPVLVYDYLKESQLVFHADEYFNRAENYELRTNRGQMTLADTKQENVVLHRVDEPYLSLFQSESIIHDAATYVAENVSSGFRSPSLPSASDIVYAPVSNEDMLSLRPLLRDVHIVTGDSSYDLSVGSSTGRRTDTPTYAYARLPTYRGTPEQEVIESSEATLDEGGFALVETLYDASSTPFNQRTSVEERITEIIEDGE